MKLALLVMLVLPSMAWGMCAVRVLDDETSTFLAASIDSEAEALALSALSEDDRRLYVRYFKEKATVATLARDFGITDASIVARRKRIVRQMNWLMENPGACYLLRAEPLPANWDDLSQWRSLERRVAITLAQLSVPERQAYLAVDVAKLSEKEAAARLGETKYVIGQRRQIAQIALGERTPRTGGYPEDWETLNGCTVLPEIRSALKLLSEAQRRALVLSTYYGMTVTEIARATETSEPNVRKAIDRARVNLEQLQGNPALVQARVNQRLMPGWDNLDSYPDLADCRYPWSLLSDTERRIYLLTVKIGLTSEEAAEFLNLKTWEIQKPQQMVKALIDDWRILSSHPELFAGSRAFFIALPSRVRDTNIRIHMLGHSEQQCADTFGVKRKEVTERVVTGYKKIPQLIEIDRQKYLSENWDLPSRWSLDAQERVLFNSLTALQRQIYLLRVKRDWGVGRIEVVLGISLSQYEKAWAKIQTALK